MMVFPKLLKFQNFSIPIQSRSIPTLIRHDNLTFLVDATPVDSNYKTKRNHRSKKILEKKSKMELYAILQILY